MAKKYELPAELPKIQFGVLPDLHKYPVIKNIMPIVHWMHKHWGEGGGGGGTKETLTIDLAEYFGQSVVQSVGPIELPESGEKMFYDVVKEAIDAGKQVVLHDVDDKGIDIDFVVERVGKQAGSGDLVRFVVARAPATICGEEPGIPLFSSSDANGVTIAMYKPLV